MSKPLLILVTGQPVPEAERRYGDFSRMIQRATPAWDGQWLSVDLRHTEVLPDPHSLAGIIVTGSPDRLGDLTDWMLRGLEYLRLVNSLGVPTLGICFGHQMLGEALGGKVAPNPNGREIGSVEVSQHHDNPLLLPALPFLTNMSHLDSVVEVPPGAQVLAATAKEPNALIQFSERTWGVQFHPEMDADIVYEYIAARRDAIEQEGTDVEALLSELDDCTAGCLVLNHFVERVVRA